MKALVKIYNVSASYVPHENENDLLLTISHSQSPKSAIKNDHSNRNGHAIGNYQLVEKLLQGKTRFIQNKL